MSRHSQPSQPTARQLVSPERFLRLHATWAQEVADQTNMPTDLYRDEEGTPRMTIEGWPMIGVFIATFQPRGRRRGGPTGTVSPVVLDAASLVLVDAPAAVRVQ